tara:strand:+ start:187 stop:1041 length:855 start_codon:yes stop_codon:yes gene_type:complete
MIKLITKKILNNLAKPHKIPLKIFRKINYYFKLKRYNQSLFEKEQNNIFESLSLNREKGIENLNIIKKNLNLHLNDKRDMSSEHEVIFSSISLNNNLLINDILEIGTYDGYNALLLSKLFPNSKIDTIDLPEDNDDYINIYNRKNKIKEFINQRNNYLSKNNNIKFLPLNSLKLLNHKKKYDLIWIDGAHGYPVVCIDIINSLNLVNNKGIIMCDDVYTNLNYINSDKIYNSIAAYETLNELQKQNLIKFKLAYKRLSPKNNFIENARKFVAIITKVHNNKILN